MREGHVPGLSIAVVDRHRLLFAAGFGAADLATGTPATADTAYLWFSMSKIVTATAALRLADEGRLDLDAPAAEYIGDLRSPGSRQPTVRQLLTHTSGLGNPLPIRWAHPADTDPPDPEALLRRLVSRRRAYRYPVGETARYSNLGYLAAGQVIAAASGPFRDYVRRAVLEPAGMTHTGYSYLPGAVAATGYLRAPRVADPVLRRVLPAGVTGARHGGYLALNRFYVDGPAYGGLVGDIADAARFLRLHLGDGELDGHRVLSSATARAMRELDHTGKPFDHGIGWFRRPTTGTRDWVEHVGAGAGFWNVMRLYPTRGLGVVVMTNSTSSYDFEPLFALLVGQCAPAECS
jgi:CubicO group peptidase (beta-lactamase class C family)